MKKTYVPIFIFVIIYLTFGCGGRNSKFPKKINNEERMEDVNISDDDFSKKVKQSVDEENISNLQVEFPVSLIQLDTSSVHQYGKFELKKHRHGWYIARNIDGNDYFERYPQVVDRRIRQENITDKIFFLSKNGSDTLKVVDLKLLNPYLNRHEHIEYAYPDFERYSAPADNEKYLYANADPDKYLTFYDGGITDLNGFTCVTYSLVAVNGNKMLTWETNTVILDKNGKLQANFVADNQITPFLLSDDGTLFAYEYGRFQDNPYDKAPDGRFEVVNLINNKVIFEISPEDGYYLGGGTRDEEYGFLHIGHGEKGLKDGSMIVDLINLNSRTRYYKKFSKEQIKKARTTFPSYLSMVNHYKFSKTNF